MIRAVLAVVLAVALLSLSLPAIEDARTKRTDQQLATELEQLDRAAADLYEAEVPRTATPGARRTVTIRIPERGVTTAGVTEVRIGGKRPAEYAYQLPGGPLRTIPASVPVMPAGGDPITLSGSGNHRLVLTLAQRNGTKTVEIRAAESETLR